MAKVSQKIHNYNYAPGIATYGVTGATGDTGENGQSIFYTNINININDDNNDFDTFAALIKAGYVALKGSTTLINRPYLDGDYFFDNDGIVYQISNVDVLMASESDQLHADDYLTIVGKIDIDDTSYVTKLDKYNRIEMNSTFYAGFDVNTVATKDASHSDLINDNYVMNIVSNTIDNDNNINLLEMSAIDNYDITNGQLNIYYNTNDKAFHIGTNGVPFVLDANTKVRDTEIQEEVDNYSTVLTSKDPITMFKAVCKICTYSIKPNNTNGASTAHLLVNVDNSNTTAYNKFLDIHENIYLKVYIENGQFIYRLKDNSVDTSTCIFKNNQFDITLNSYFQYKDSSTGIEPEILAASLMYNTEIFIDKE